MFRNYLLTAWRNLVRHRLFSAINILGLAIGLACCILITLFVHHELSYDRHYDNAERIVRVARHFTNANIHLATVAPPFGPLIAEDFPEVEAMTRIRPMVLPMSFEDRAFNDLVLGLADPNALEFFGFELERGDAATAIERPFTVVLTESAARRFFGNADPIGQPITVLGQLDVEVTGVMADLPENTHMRFDMLGSIATVFKPDRNWQPENLPVKADAGVAFVQTQPCFDVELLRHYMARLVDQQLTHRFSVIVGTAAVPSADIALWLGKNLRGAVMPAKLV